MEKYSKSDFLLENLADYQLTCYKKYKMGYKVKAFKDNPTIPVLLKRFLS
ncbi:hypothetical protein [Spirosoma flavum]|uniref:Uncharacterized protein n=1 Tax=Spirosoma flavum TaxID=2048557 RepID=A0ABW6ANI8_9BACT